MHYEGYSSTSISIPKNGAINIGNMSYANIPQATVCAPVVPKNGSATAADPATKLPPTPQRISTVPETAKPDAAPTATLFTLSLNVNSSSSSVSDLELVGPNFLSESPPRTPPTTAPAARITATTTHGKFPFGSTKVIGLLKQ